MTRTRPPVPGRRVGHGFSGWIPLAFPGPFEEEQPVFVVPEALIVSFLLTFASVVEEDFLDVFLVVP